MRLCFCLVGYLASGVPALEPIGCCVGLSLWKKMVASRWVHANEYSPELSLPVSWFPQWATDTSRLCRRPSILAGRSGLIFYETIAFFPRYWCEWDLVYSLPEWNFCFPEFCGIPGVKSYCPSKPDSLEAPPSIARPSGWGELSGAQNFPLSHWGFLFVFRCQVSFEFLFFFFLVGGCSVISCDFGVFIVRGKLMAFCSIILSP